MRQRLLLLGLVTIALATLASCARRSSESATGGAVDSTVVANPTERAYGQLTPQAPAPPPSPRATSRRAAPEARPAEPAPASPPAAEPAPPPTPGTESAPSGPAMNVKWGTGLLVTISEEISSETAKPGDEWVGTLRSGVIADEREAFPAGSLVHGTVKEVKPAAKGDRAMLTLEVTSIEAHERTWPLSATAEPLLAESPRARNLAGLAGGAAAGALIGGAVGGEKGAVIGGLLGGGAAGGAVARSKGYQVVVKPGTTIRFTVAADVIVRL